MTLNGVLIKKVICTGPNETIPGNTSGTFILSLCFHCTCQTPTEDAYIQYICNIYSRYLYMYACSWVPFRVSDCWDAGMCLVCVNHDEWLSAVHCVIHFVQCTCATFGLKKKKNNISLYVIVTYSHCWFCYRTPNCTSVLLWILYWSPNQAGYDHELYLWGASSSWWEIRNAGAG